MAYFIASILAIYCYAFYLGSVWIYHGIWNDIYKRTYTAGDILCCFFGIVFGMMALGMAGPNMKAVGEGKTAGKMAFDIIERVPSINLEDTNSKILNDIKGEIEFKNVSFSYPTRGENQVLKDFSYKF